MRWDFGTFSHIAGKATGVAGKLDLTAAGMSLVQNLVLFVIVILVIVGATRILGTKKRAVQAAQV